MLSRIILNFDSEIPKGQDYKDYKEYKELGNQDSEFS